MARHRRCGDRGRWTVIERADWSRNLLRSAPRGHSSVAAGQQQPTLPVRLEPGPGADRRAEATQVVYVQPGSDYRRSLCSIEARGEREPPIRGSPRGSRLFLIHHHVHREDRRCEEVDELNPEQDRRYSDLETEVAHARLTEHAGCRQRHPTTSARLSQELPQEEDPSGTGVASAISLRPASRSRQTSSPA